ncbi:AOX, alternative oxidase mitochondrial precursor [Suillus bovinus]|uniref:AOX, alternative oxidase mitochondrial precursor n=1 Tax=Suillus bovinus TaxID=48563 RepID=UPI001B8722D1|nr:AOX, alternative oxidase mitochondrial precursor [Suillus bovinus]KAG2155775.1 AOX, alternative oxidase mitochondrial precursor [Suillus bovinus]
MSSMLRTALVRAGPACRIGILHSGLSLAPKLGPTFATRALIHSGQPNNNSLTGKKINEESVTGTEGLHFSNPFAEDSAASKQGLTAPDVSTSPPTIVRGDWVLFHPVYSQEELKAVEVLQAEAKTIPDKIAYYLVKFTRWGFDVVSGYKHKPIPAGREMSLEELRKGGYILDDKAWLSRILFLETIAGVPGMVAAMLRHLTSLRLMRRDSGWIHTLLQEAENERMHLMTFMTLRKPSLFFRGLILGAQGVYFNLFLLGGGGRLNLKHQLLTKFSTRCIEDMESGRLPEWNNIPAPEIAKDYWRLGPDAKLLDVIFANLNIETDVNPFALREPDMHVKGRKLGFSREESEQYVRESRQILEDGKTKSK